MTDPARAARLKAIAERLDRTDPYRWLQDIDDLRFLLAHVETLTQQVAELTKLRLSQRIDIDRFMAQIRNLQQENARLTADRDAFKDSEREALKVVAQQYAWRVEAQQAAAKAEQQRDAAHAALRKVRGHTSRGNPSIELAAGLLASIERIVDAALAASAPQKEQADPEWLLPALEAHLRLLGCKCSKPLVGYSPGFGPRCRLCNVDSESAPAQETERGR